MHRHFVRTAGGQAEVAGRALGLPRPVRNLLLVINPSQPAERWLAQVNGVSEDDLAHLLAEGLIAPATPPAPPPSPEATAWQALGQRIDAAPHALLYTTLTAQDRQRLGLVRGYSFVMAVEKAPDVATLRALAHQLAEQLRASGHTDALQDLARALA